MDLILPYSFYFIRHGESINNRDKLVNGWTDCDLTENGRQAAAKAGAVLKDLGINRIVTSDLKRAVNTAQIIAEKIAFNGNIERYPELRERNWGIYENGPITNRPGLDIDPEGGESWERFFNRVVPAIGKLNLNSDSLLVGHSGIYRVIRATWGFNETFDRVPNAVPLCFTKNSYRIL